MDNINFETLEEFLDNVNSGDTLHVYYGLSKRKSFTMEVLSVNETSIVTKTSTGFKIEISLNSYNESTEKLVFKNLKNNQINSLDKLRQIFKIQNEKTYSFNPSIAQQQKEKKDREYNDKIQSFKDYNDLDENSSSPYTYTQISFLNEKLEEIKNKIKEGTISLNHSEENKNDPKLTSKFYMYIYQTPINDYKNALKNYWDEWLEDNGDDIESIKNGSENAPKPNDIFDDSEVNRITLLVSIDKNKTIYINKNLGTSNRLKDYPVQAKPGHFFTEDNFYFDEDDLNRGIFLGGKNGLIIHSISDVKISYNEDDPDSEYRKGMSDSEIIDYIKDNKSAVDFLNRNPSFLEYLLSGGKKRRNKPITKQHLDYFNGKIAKFNSSNSEGDMHVISSDIPSLNGVTLNGTPNRSGSKIVIPITNGSGEYLGKIFLKQKDNIYDFENKKFNTDTFEGNVALKNGDKGKIKINV